jgi:hypothetical protein
LHIFAEKIRKKNPWKAHDSNISTASIPYTVRFIKMSAEGEGAYRGAGAARRFVLFIVLFIVSFVAAISCALVFDIKDY